MVRRTELVSEMCCTQLAARNCEFDGWLPARGGQGTSLKRKETVSQSSDEVFNWPLTGCLALAPQLCVGKLTICYVII